MTSASLIPVDVVPDAIVSMEVWGNRGNRFWGGVVANADPKVGRVHVQGYRHKGAPKMFSLEIRKDGKYDSQSNELVTLRLANDKEKITILRFREESVIVHVSGFAHVERHTVKKTTESGPGICLCGCGGATQSKFIAGHDSRIHSLLSKIVKGQTGPETLPDIFITNFRSVKFCVKNPQFLVVMESLATPKLGCIDCANGVPFAEHSTTMHASGQLCKA